MLQLSYAFAVLRVCNSELAFWMYRARVALFVARLGGNHMYTAHARVFAHATLSVNAWTFERQLCRYSFGYSECWMLYWIALMVLFCVQGTAIILRDESTLHTKTTIRWNYEEWKRSVLVSMQGTQILLKIHRGYLAKTFGELANF